MALIIGSTAMQFNFPDFTREPKDLDYFAPPEQIPAYLAAKSVDNDPFWHDSWRGSRLERANWDMATPDELYTIKVSHSSWELPNGSYDKHMCDILFLQDHGAKLDMQLYKLLYPVWVEKHGTKKMTLAKSSGMFFADAVTRIYDHDSIHRSIARRDHALYEEFLTPGETVNMDMSKVWASEHSKIVEMFREEIAATALERWLIPTNYKFSPGLAWKLGLKKTITSLTKGKSSLFLIENFREFMLPFDNIDDESYLARHLRQKDRLILLGEADQGMQQM
jgi:hypothetical protein